MVMDVVIIVERRLDYRMKHYTVNATLKTFHLSLSLPATASGVATPAAGVRVCRVHFMLHKSFLKLLYCSSYNTVEL